MAIVVCPLSQVQRMVALHKPARVVSLLDPDTPFPKTEGFGERHLKLGVHDITQSIDGWEAPQEGHVRTLLDFIGTWEREAPMLVHCYAGISRSTATAFITACVHNPRADEEEIAWTMRQANATAWPNKLIVEIADDALGRGGRMLRAIETIGPGRSWAEFGENDPFSIPSTFPDKA